MCEGAGVFESPQWSACASAPSQRVKGKRVGSDGPQLTGPQGLRGEVSKEHWGRPYRVALPSGATTGDRTWSRPRLTDGDTEVQRAVSWPESPGLRSSRPVSSTSDVCTGLSFLFCKGWLSGRVSQEGLLGMARCPQRSGAVGVGR